MRRLAVPHLILLLVFPFVACKVATVRPIESDAGSNPQQDFDSAAYVHDLWTGELIHAIEDAVDLADLLPVFTVDASGAVARWSHGDDGGLCHLIVVGQGRVVDVDTSTRTGRATVEIATINGPAEIQVQIGPVFRGTAIRDALPGVSFDQFVNQLQFADVANQLNDRAVGELGRSVDLATLEGQSVRIAGAVSLSPSDTTLLVTPVRLVLDTPEP